MWEQIVSFLAGLLIGELRHHALYLRRLVNAKVTKAERDAGVTPAIATTTGENDGRKSE